MSRHSAHPTLSPLMPKHRAELGAWPLTLDRAPSCQSRGLAGQGYCSRNSPMSFKEHFLWGRPLWYLY